MFCLYTNGNCGFISLYYALKFEKEEILKKYNIERVEDLYNLFMNEVFNKYKHQPFLNTESISIENLFIWKYLAYYTQKNANTNGACSPLYWAMMAKYLNIHINLIKIEPSACSRFDGKISYMSKINKQIINPECIVSLHLSHFKDELYHVEYIGKTDDEKKELYEFEKGREFIRDDINFLKEIEMYDEYDEDDDDFCLDETLQDINSWFLVK